MIPQRDLSLLSNRLARRGGRRIPEAVLEKDYCLSWFLVGLSATPLKDILVFKGGTAIKKCYIPDYRFSEDLDFTLHKEETFETIRPYLDEASSRTEEASGIKIRFSRYDRHSHRPRRASTASGVSSINCGGFMTGLPQGDGENPSTGDIPKLP